MGYLFPMNCTWFDCRFEVGYILAKLILKKFT